MGEEHVDDCAEDGASLEAGNDAAGDFIGRVAEVVDEVWLGDRRGDNTGVVAKEEACNGQPGR